MSLHDLECPCKEKTVDALFNLTEKLKVGTMFDRQTVV